MKGRLALQTKARAISCRDLKPARTDSRVGVLELISLNMRMDKKDDVKDATVCQRRQLDSQLGACSLRIRSHRLWDYGLGKTCEA